MQLACFWGLSAGALVASIGFAALCPSLPVAPQVRLSFTVEGQDVAVARGILDHCMRKNVGGADDEEGGETDGVPGSDDDDDDGDDDDGRDQGRVDAAAAAAAAVPDGSVRRSKRTRSAAGADGVGSADGERWPSGMVAWLSC
jgi:hypothetical protein